nr:MAG TPA: hypothetical protein [Caudoviricetes sp.]
MWQMSCSFQHRCRKPIPSPINTAISLMLINS